MPEDQTTSTIIETDETIYNAPADIVAEHDEETSTTPPIEGVYVTNMRISGDIDQSVTKAITVDLRKLRTLELLRELEQ